MLLSLGVGGDDSALDHVQNYKHYYTQIPDVPHLFFSNFRFLVTGESFRSIAFSYKVGPSTVGKIVFECSQILREQLASRFMNMPQDAEDWKIIPATFLCFCSFYFLNWCFKLLSPDISFLFPSLFLFYWDLIYTKIYSAWLSLVDDLWKFLYHCMILHHL